MGRKRNADQAVKTSTRDLLQNWNEYYVKNDFGMGVQCGQCQKWRLTYQYQENKEVPKYWTCSMWKINNRKTGNCSIPSDLTEEDFAQEDYPPGTLVWAKLAGFPWWPAMIEDSPDTQEFFVVNEDDEEEYHVNFFGQPQRSWVKASNVKEFLGSMENPNKNSKGSAAKLKESIKQAEEASKLPIKERLQKYSFAVRYKGRWLKIKDKEDISLPPACPSHKKMAKFANLESCANNEARPEKGDRHQTPTRKRASPSCKKSESKKKSVDEKAGHSSACQDDEEEENYDQGCEVGELTRRNSIQSNDSADGTADDDQSEENGASDNDLIRNGASDNDLIRNGASDNDLMGNGASDNNLMGDGASGNDLMGNGASGNDLMGNGASDDDLNDSEEESEEDGEGMSNPYDPDDKTVYSALEIHNIAKEYAEYFHHPSFQPLIYPFNRSDSLYIRDDENSFIK